MSDRGSRSQRWAFRSACLLLSSVVVGAAWAAEDEWLKLQAPSFGVVSRLDLMTQVWGYSAAVVSRTVDTHVAELRRKLEDRPSDPQHILTVRKIGYPIEVLPDYDREMNRYAFLLVD